MEIQPSKQSGHPGSHEYSGEHSERSAAIVLQTGREVSGRPLRGTKAVSLERALADALLDDGEQEFDCMLLFEFPVAMLESSSGEDGKRAAACLCQFSGAARLIFITTSKDGHSVRLFSEDEVSCELAELSWSYARILSFMPGTLARQQHSTIN
ncbi:MAG: hypothetical protein KDJ69_01715 [Nitratireductor sp.]|nr:hypothetical protein [Nitratireductor sp.]